MKRSILRMLVASTVIFGMVSFSHAEKGKNSACGKEKAEKTSKDKQSSNRIPPPWVCPLFPIYQYSPTEFLYHAERLETSCGDVPQAAALVGYWTLPRDCELGECVDASFMKQVASTKDQKAKSVPEFGKMRERVDPGMVQDFPGSSHLSANVDVNVPYIKFEFEDDELLTRHVVARVNRIRVTLPDPDNVGTNITKTFYTAWETLGVPRGSQVVTVGNGDIQIIEVLNAQHEVVGKLIDVTVTHPRTHERVKMRVMLAD